MSEKMYKTSETTLKIWNDQKKQTTVDDHPLVKTMDNEDFSRLEDIYGYPLPSACKEFISMYGCALFYDKVPYRFGYVYERDNMTEQWAATINSFLDFSALSLAHTHMIADADNDTGEAFFPQNMLPFAGDLQQNLILLELGTETPRVWYWEDQASAWEQGDNNILGFVSDNLYDFINNLT